MGGEGDGGGVQGGGHKQQTLSFMMTLNNIDPVLHDDPQQHPHPHHQSTSLLYPCNRYISANNRDIDTKLSGCIQIPKEHSLLHSDPHGQHHHSLHRLHQGPTKIEVQGDLTF